MTPTTTLDAIYNALVSVLQDVVDPSVNTKVFQNTDGTWNIYDGPQTPFSGTPAAVLIPTDGPASKFQSNYVNNRGYAYMVFIAMDTQLKNYAATRKNMRLIIDAVLDALDRSDFLDQTVDILEAASLKWIEEETANGVNIIAPLQIEAHKLIQAGQTS